MTRSFSSQGETKRNLKLFGVHEMLKMKRGPLFGITLSKWGSVTPLACRRVLRAGRLFSNSECL